MSEQSIHKPGGMRRFRMDRAGQLVAQGVQFGDGIVVLRWWGETRSIAVYESLADFKAVHVEGHDGTVLRWEDKCCWQCGTSVWPHGATGCTDCGCTWDGEASDEPEPEKGQWVHAGTLEPRTPEQKP